MTAQVSGNVCVLSADVDNNDVGVDFDNTIIVIDGEEMKPNYVDNKISVTKTLASGTHTATLRAFDLSGRSVGYETISFDVK